MLRFVMTVATTAAVATQMLSKSGAFMVVRANGLEALARVVYDTENTGEHFEFITL